MNEHYPQPEGTWGGNAKGGIGGSPVNCLVTKQDVASALSLFIR